MTGVQSKSQNFNTKVNLNVDKFNGQTGKINPKARIAL